MALSLKNNARERDLGRLIVRIHRQGRVFHWGSTGYIYYPPPDQVREKPDYYQEIRSFQTSSKGRQRSVLGEYVDVPQSLDEAESGPFVVRPTRHSGGEQFHVVESHSEARDVLSQLGGGYASSLFCQDTECRAFFVGGEHISTMEKRLYTESGEESSPERYYPEENEPWNRSVCDDLVFYTRGDRVGYQDPLQNTSFYDDIGPFFEDYPFDIAAIDVGIQGDQYAVFELNQAPRLTVESTLNPVTEAFINLR